MISNFYFFSFAVVESLYSASFSNCFFFVLMMCTVSAFSKLYSRNIVSSRVDVKRLFSYTICLLQSAMFCCFNKSSTTT